jgi:hypothetical protein
MAGRSKWKGATIKVEGKSKGEAVNEVVTLLDVTDEKVSIECKLAPGAVAPIPGSSGFMEGTVEIVGGKVRLTKCTITQCN